MENEKLIKILKAVASENRLMILRSLRREKELSVGDLAESTGLSVHKIQLVAFVLGSSLAALGGVLLARYIGYISPESFNPGISVAFITMLVIGGQRSVWGPLVGALLLTPLPELFRGAVHTQNIFYGAALILILRFMPGGLASLMSLFKRTEDKK